MDKPSLQSSLEAAQWSIPPLAMDGKILQQSRGTDGSSGGMTFLFFKGTKSECECVILMNFQQFLLVRQHSSFCASPSFFFQDKSFQIDHT